jgi:hypothetical protein
MQTEKKPKACISRVLSDGRMVEVTLKDGLTRFAVCSGGKVSYEDQLKEGEVTYVPVRASNNLIRHAAVLLPSEAKEYGDERELLEAIRAYLRRYVSISPSFEDVVCAYVMLTWVYDAYNELCYLRFSGDYGTGKSRALYVIGSICNKAFFASAASTLSPVFYTLDVFRGTLIMDEADFRYSDLQSDITKIMNNGSVKGFPVLRQTQTATKDFDPRAFNVYGPKIVAMRRTFDDMALESRFLSEDMNTVRLGSDVPHNLPKLQQEEARELRNKLLMYRFKQLSNTTIKTDVVDRAQSGRFNQTVVPLLSTVSDEEVRSSIRRVALHGQRKQSGQRSHTMEARLIETLIELCLLDIGKVGVSVGSVTASFKQKMLGDTERPITSRFVGHILRNELGLYSFKRHGVYTIPTTEYEKILEMAKRYGIHEE